MLFLIPIILYICLVIYNYTQPIKFRIVQNGNDEYYLEKRNRIFFNWSSAFDIDRDGNIDYSDYCNAQYISGSYDYVKSRLEAYSDRKKYLKEKYHKKKIIPVYYILDNEEK